MKIKFAFLILALTLPTYAQVAMGNNVIANPTGSTSTSFSLNAANLKYDINFTVPTSFTLEKVNFKTASITGTPTCTVRIETDSSGRPSGTLAWANATATSVAVVSGWQTEITLAASGTLSVGTTYHLVISNDAATPASNNFAVNDQGVAQTQLAGYQTAQPTPLLTASFNGTSWSNRTAPIFMLVSTGGTKRFGQPIDSTATITMGSTTNYGIKFTASFGGVAGGVSFCHLPNGTPNLTVKIYDASDNLIASQSVATGLDSAIGNSRHCTSANFATPPTLIAGTTYRVVMIDSTGTDRIDYASAPSSPDYRLLSPATKDITHTQGTTGSWVDTTGRTLAMSVWFDSITAGGTGGTATQQSGAFAQ